MTVGTLLLVILGGGVLVFFGGGWLLKKLLGWNDPGDLGIAGMLATLGVTVLLSVGSLVHVLSLLWNEPIG